jgi:Na+-translocating ferredoxin:NAD+ oxidoreductase RNF subunit RnfB
MPAPLAVLTTVDLDTANAAAAHTLQRLTGVIDHLNRSWNMNCHDVNKMTIAQINEQYRIGDTRLGFLCQLDAISTLQYHHLQILLSHAKDMALSRKNNERKRVAHAKKYAKYAEDDDVLGISGKMVTVDISTDSD